MIPKPAPQPDAAPDASPFFYVMDQPARVLFADDDPILREFAQVHLGTEGGAILTAEDGLDCLDVLEREAVDILLLDLQMPRLDGFDVLKRLRADDRFAHLPVIVVTGREDVTAIDQAFEAGATSFIVKPINWRLLSYQLRFVLRSHGSETQLMTERLRARLETRHAKESLRKLAEDGSVLLSMAMQQEGTIRAVAKRYAERLHEAMSGDPRLLRDD